MELGIVSALDRTCRFIAFSCGAVATYNVSMSWIDLIIGAIVLLSFAGPAIGKIWGAIKQQREKENAWRERNSGNNLDELAEQRRRELMRQREAQSSRVAQNQGRNYSAEVAGSSQIQPQQPAQPGNMTMAERIARARAKAEYERRAQQLGQSPQQSRPAERPDATDLAERRRQEAERQARQQREREQAEALARQQREAELERRRAEAEAQRRQQQAQQQQGTRQQRQRQARPQQTTQRSRAAAAAQQRQRQRQQPERAKSSSSKVAAAYRIEDEPDFSVEKRHIQKRLATRQALREAIVLREILDKPVSMRDAPTDAA